jgi:hypothetical protein
MKITPSQFLYFWYHRQFLDIELCLNQRVLHVAVAAGQVASKNIIFRYLACTLGCRERGFERIPQTEYIFIHSPAEEYVKISLNRPGEALRFLGP